MEKKQKYIKSKFLIITNSQLGFINGKKEYASINIAVSKSFTTNLTDLKKVDDNKVQLRVKLYKKDNTTPRIFKVFESASGETTKVNAEKIVKILMENGAKIAPKQEFDKLSLIK